MLHDINPKGRVIFDKLLVPQPVQKFYGNRRSIQFAEALSYKRESGGFDSPWGQ
jgi:hypothetical protein